MPLRGQKMAKMPMLAIFGTFFAILKPLTGIKTLSNYLYPVEEVLSFWFGGSYVKIG